VETKNKNMLLDELIIQCSWKKKEKEKKKENENKDCERTNERTYPQRPF
jgi:hypothetical protein